jgi:hypothetical protein
VKGEKMNDEQAHDFYADPAHQGIAPGAARRPPRTERLGASLPVRFPSETVTRIREAAAADGFTVSSWVRRVVDAELARRVAHRNEDVDVASELERLASQLRRSA